MRDHGVALVTLVLAACTSTASEGAPRATVPGRSLSAEEPPTAQEKVAAEPPPAPEPPAPAPRHERTVYDLVRHVDHAELREGPVVVMDHGTPPGAKYTLGGWRTRVGADAEDAGASVATLRGRHGEVLLPVHLDGPVKLSVRVRAPGDGRFTVYLDGESLRSLRGDRGALEVFELTLPEGTEIGEHMLGFRGARRGKVGSEQTGVAIDWVRLGPADVVHSHDAPADLEALRDGAGALVIPDGVSLGYTFVARDRTWLVGELAGEGDASLEVSAVFDDGSVQRLHTHGVRSEAPLSVDLSELAGRVVRLELGARGAVAIRKARVVERLEADPTREPKQARNVLIYLIDTLRADHLKAFNPGTRVQTPGMDALARRATLFTAAHTQENWTKPSVATLLSALLPWEHHATTTEAVVPRSVRLLPQYLQEQGYFTGAFIANGYVGGNFGFDRGWDTYRNYIREGRRSRAKFLAADVLDWLDKRPQEVPFFLYVHSIDPHVPYRPTRRFMSLYDPEPYDGPVNFAHDFALLEKVKSGRVHLSERDKQHLEALYDSEISYHDVHFNAILKALESRGLDEDTLVVVTADHGEEFWDHGSVGHGHNVYEELLHVPMLVRLPGVGEGVRIDHHVGLVDVLPTVFEAIGEPVPEGLSGRSFLPALLGHAPSAPAASISGFMNGWRAISIDGLKLIQRTEKRMMVHDLRSDPQEQHDVSETHPLTLRYLRGQLGLALADSEGVRRRGRPKKRKHRRQDTTIDAETEAQLRALGYVGSSRR